MFPYLPKQNRQNPDIRDLLSDPNNSLISGLHCILLWSILLKKLMVTEFSFLFMVFVNINFVY